MNWFCIRFGFICQLLYIHFGVIFSSVGASFLGTEFEPSSNPKWFPKLTLRATIFERKADISQHCGPNFSTFFLFWEREPLAHYDWCWCPFGTLLHPFCNLLAPVRHPCGTLLNLFGKFAALSWVPWYFTTNASFIFPSSPTFPPSDPLTSSPFAPLVHSSTVPSTRRPSVFWTFEHWVHISYVSIPVCWGRLAGARACKIQCLNSSKILAQRERASTGTALLADPPKICAGNRPCPLRI